MVSQVLAVLRKTSCATLFIVFAFIAQTTISVPARANGLVLNGGFDDLGGQTYNPCCETPFTTGVPDWSDSVTDQNGIHGFDYGTGNTAAQNPGYDWASPYVVNSPEGGDFFFDDGGPTYQATLSQTITGLTVGDIYVLTFYQAAAEINSGGDGIYQYGYPMNWDVSLGSSVFQAPAMVIPAPVSGVPQ